MRPRKSSSPRPLSFSLARLATRTAVVAALAGASSAFAQNIWTAGSSTDFSWDTGTNWSLALEPSATDDVIFNSPIPNPGTLANPETILLTAGELANTLTFNDSYILSGGNVTLTLGSVTVANGKTATIGSQVLGTAGLTLGGNGTLILSGATNNYSGGTTIGSTGTLSIASDANLGATGAGNGITFTAAGTLAVTGDTTSARNIALTANGKVDVASTRTFTENGTVSGAGSFTKTGNGTLVLGGTNTNSGAVAVNGGILSIASSANLGDNSVTNTLGLNGGTLRATASVDLGVNRAIAVGATGGTLSAGPTNGTVLTVSGSLSGSGPLGITGGGLVNLTANNSTFSGNVNVDSVGGTANTILRLSNNSALTSGTVTLAQGVAAAGGTGTSLDLAGVTIGSGVSLVLNSNNASNFRSALTTSAGANVWNGGIALNGDGVDQLNSLNVGNTLTINGDITTGGSGFTGVLFIRGAGNGTINGLINIPNGVLSKTDGGTWTINSSGGSWGATNISVGTIKLGGSSVIPLTSVVTLGQNDANNATLDLNGFSHTLAGLATNPTTGVTGVKSVTSTAGTLTLDIAGASNFSYGGILAGTMNVIKQGTGTETLNGISTFTGTTAINNGRIVLGNVGGLSVGDITVASGAVLQNAHNAATQNFPANVILNGGSFIHDPGANQQLNFTPGKAITIGALGGTVEVSPGAGAASKILLVGNQLTGSGTLIKTGVGVLQLNAANTTFSGAVSLNAGTIEYQQTDALGTGTTTVTVGGTGDFALNSAAVSARHNFVLNTGGTLSANGTLNATTYTGPINVAGNANAALRYFQTTTTANGFTITGNLSGAGGLNVTAPGAATLNLGTLATGLSRTTNNSAYTGNLTVGINATVVINNSLGNGGITLSGGAVQYKGINVTAPTLGTAGINAFYYNFGSNPGTASNLFASSLVQGSPFVSTRTDVNVNMPQPGANGNYPILPVAGFGVAGAGGLSDGIMWKGLLTINAAGTYQFSGTDDDNAQLYIDGQSLGTLGVVAAQTNYSAGLVTLSSGVHSIVVKFTQGVGGGYTTLSYNGGVGSDTGANTVLVGSVANTLTNGAMAATDLGPLSVTTSSTLDLSTDATASTLSVGNNVTTTLTSPTISGLTVTGATTLNGGTATITNSTVALALNGAIGESASTAVTINGGYLTSFNAPNTYSGLTTVTAGELDLNATGGNSIPASLIVNAANGTGTISNVKLLKSNQIADVATVTVTQGALDIGAFSDTVGTLTLNGGTGGLTNTPAFINGTSGTLSAGTFDLRVGTVTANLNGISGLAKNTVGTLILAGNNTYSGATTVSSGTLVARGTNALGAGGAGNGTSVSGGLLNLQGANLANEDLTINGSSLLATGTNTIASLTTGSASTVFVSNGELIINGALNVGGGALTKTGDGALTFASPQATFPTVTHTAGAIGFSGTQSFGAASVPAGLAYQFNSDPGAGVAITAAAGTSVIAGYAGADTLLSRITAASAGTLALSTDSAAALNFTGSSVRLGARGIATYSGALTPNGTAYQFGGVSVSGLAPNVLNLTSALSGANSVNVSGGIVNLTANNSNTTSGGLNVTGGTVRVLNDSSLGTATSVVTLNGGTLQYTTTNQSGVTGQFAQMGTGIGGIGRVINIGAAGGTIDVQARSFGGAGLAMVQDNAITGAAGTTLTKSGLGQLFILKPLDGTTTGFAGNLVIAPNSGQFNILGSGYVRGLASVTVGQSSNFQADNNTLLGQNRHLVYNAQVNGTAADKIGDTIPITLNGGTLLLNARNVALSLILGGYEKVGTVTAGLGQDTINSVRNGTGGSEIAISNLVRTVGAGTYNLLGQNLGLTGDNSRIVPIQINGVAPTTNSFVGGWLVVNSANFGTFLTQASTGLIGGIGNYGAAGFLAYGTTATATAPNTAGWTTGAVGTAAANVVLGAVGAGQTFTTGALRLSLGAAQTVTFLGTTGTPDTIVLESGGLLSDGAAFARTLGVTTSNFTRGRLTAGTTTAASELFLHNNANTLQINSQIINNLAGGVVTVVKDLDGTVTLDGSNTYSGGTNVFRGTMTANSTGSFGTGGVFIKNSVVNLGNIGATTGAVGVAANAAVYTTSDQAEIVLTNGTAGAAGAYNAAGDRFSISAGSQIYANSPGAGFGLNSLTRVATPTSFTGGGQIFLAPDAIVRHNLTNGIEQGTGILTIQNLGTAADLYFSPGNAGGVLQTLTVGAGTPWKGISTDRNASTWTTGAINANSDFYLQGLLRDGVYAALNLGADNTAGNISIFNNAGKPINAFVQGQVTLTEDSPVRMPGDLTFVLTPGSLFQPNRTASFGNPSLVGGGIAKVIVQSGATLDPGNFVALGAAANQETATLTGLPYPVASPLNGSLTVEAGGQFIINDASGIGSAPVGSYLLKSDSLLNLVTNNAFYGRGNQPFDNIVDTTGYINPGQFVLEPGVIVRVEADVLKLSQFITGVTNGEKSVIEIANGNRNITNQNNPFLRPVTGSPTIQPEDIRLANGGILTNDDADRQLNEGRGHIILGNGAVLAGTSETYLNIQESLIVEPNATITIGSTRFIDGMPKLGGIQLTGPNSNDIPNSATINVLNGAQILFTAQNVWPDSKSLDLPFAVTAFPSAGAVALLPGTGSTLGINNATTEVMGPLTGLGAVIGNNAGAVATGFGASADFTSGVVWKSTNGQNPGLVKIGSTKMTLTGVSDSTGDAFAEQGNVEISGTGQTAFTSWRLGKGATLTLDNTASATPVNRLGGKSLVGQGGTFNLIGNATTPVTETLANVFNSASAGLYGATVNSGYSYINITPGAATTTLVVTSLENFQSAGIAQQRNATWVLRGATLGNAPATYNSAATLSINGANLTNGLIQVTTPNFVNGTNGNTFGVGAGGNILGAVGTSLVAMRPDYLGTTNLTGQGEGFVTEDIIAGGMRLLASSEYGSTVRDNQATAINLKLSGTLNTSGDTRIQSITMTPGSTLSIQGTRPLDATPSRLHIAGGIFVQSGAASTINGGTNNFLQANGGASLFLHTQGDLNLNAAVFSDNAIVKTNAGTLNVGPGVLTAFRGGLTVDDGVVNLAANNSFYVGRAQNGWNPNNNLYLNGGTLNLGSNSEVINVFSNSNPLPGQGGTLTSSSAATVTIGGGGQFSGAIAGSISLDKALNNTLLLTGASTYSGTTLVRGGTLQLRDSGAISSTQPVNVNYASLVLDNSYLSNVANRIAPSAAVTLNGGTLNITGAANVLASQTINTLTLGEGVSSITGNAGGSGATEINIGNLVRAAGSGAVVNFNANYGFLGTANNNTAVRTFVTNVNGSTLALNDGIIAGWAVAGLNNGGNGNVTFATRLATTGVGAMGNTADGYAAFESGDITTATATQNVQDGGARTLTTTKTINSLRTIGLNLAWTVNSGVGLTIDTGGWIHDVGGTLSVNAAANAAGMSITSNSGELDHYVQQSTTGINIPIVGAIDFVKAGPGAANLRPEGSYTVTNTSGTNVLTTATTGGLVVGMPVSGTGVPNGSTITTITPGVSFTISSNTTAAVTTAVPVFGNSYTGKTIVNGGTLSANLSAPGLPGYRAIPGNIVLQGGGTLTEANFANQIEPSANLTLASGSRINFLNAASTSETINSITFTDSGGITGSTNVDRLGLQTSSVLNLTASTAITATNTNPNVAMPFIGGFLGNIAFTPVSGASTLQVNSPVTVNGLAAVGLAFDAAIGAVPTGIAEGGLIKSGNGLLVLRAGQSTVSAATASMTSGSANITLPSALGFFVGMPVTGSVAGIPAGTFIKSIAGNVITLSQNATATSAVQAVTGAMNNFNQTASTYNGSLASLVDVLNVSQGFVRVDANAGLGSNSANTTVQSGAVLLGSNVATQTIVGSITLKGGSSLGATINSFTLGNATTTVSNQSVLNVPSGTVNIAAYDYFVPATNGGNITINGRLTGAGNINIVGPQITFGAGGGGTITVGNPLLSGASSGQNDYSGTISVGANAILQNLVALPAVTTNTRNTGNALATATVNLNGGRLRIRDDGQATGDLLNQTVVYGNNVTLTGDSFLDANRNLSAATTGNTINLGSLTVPSGTRSLTVDSGNNYVVKFSTLNGPGTLVKGGQSFLTIDSTAANASFTLAGPQGLSVGPTFNGQAGSAATQPITFTAASNTFANFGVGGFYIAPAKTFNVSGTFAVNANPGNVSGQLAVSNTTTISAGTFLNNGRVGATGGAASISATTGFQGTGTYVTAGQALTLNGSLSAGSPKFAGDSTVTVTGTAHAVGTTDVQSGTLLVQPTANATSSGTIRVLASPGSVAGATTAPIAAVSSTLNFDNASGSLTHTGSIVNNGLVQVSNGTTTVTGAIAGTAPTYTPGLLEGMIQSGSATNPFNSTAGRQLNPGNFGIALEPRMAQTNAVTQNALTGWTDGQMWVYTGYIKDNDGVFSFLENIDDSTGVWVDGTKVIDNSTFNVLTSSAYSAGFSGTATTAGANAGTPTQNFGAGISLPGYGSGWHLIEMRFANGGGGAGPVIANGFTANYGFGYKDGIGAFDGADYIKPIDNGTGNLFVTPVGGKGTIQVNGGATLNAGSFNQTTLVNIGTFGIAGTMNVTGTGVSQADAVTIGDNSFLTLTTHTGGPGNVKAIDTSALTVGTGAKFDLTNNVLVARGGSLSAIKSLLTTGFNGGSWNGVGINSSTANADALGLTAVGYGNNADLGYTTFGNVTGLTGAEILVKTTYYGDNDLSGTVTTDDFSLFLDGFTGAAPASWLNGDYDYSGVVTTDDFSLFLASLTSGAPALSGSSPAASGGSSAGAPAAVPEPGSIGLLFVGALGLLGRRRRNSK